MPFEIALSIGTSFYLVYRNTFMCKVWGTKAMLITFEVHLNTYYKDYAYVICNQFYRNDFFLSNKLKQRDKLILYTIK